MRLRNTGFQTQSLMFPELHYQIEACSRRDFLEGEAFFFLPFLPLHPNIGDPRKSPFVLGWMLHFLTRNTKSSVCPLWAEMQLQVVKFFIRKYTSLFSSSVTYFIIESLLAVSSFPHSLLHWEGQNFLPRSSFIDTYSVSQALPFWLWASSFALLTGRDNPAPVHK